MNSCCNGHGEIIFFGGDCPVCSRDQEIYDLDKRIAEFILNVESLKMEMEKTDKILADLKAGIVAYRKPYTDTTKAMNEFKKEGIK